MELLNRVFNHIYLMLYKIIHKKYYQKRNSIKLYKNNLPKNKEYARSIWYKDRLMIKKLQLKYIKIQIVKYNKTIKILTMNRKNLIKILNWIWKFKNSKQYQRMTL